MSQREAIEELPALSVAQRTKELEVATAQAYRLAQHDILTGSTADGSAYPPGEDMTCGNWTKSNGGRARVGHHDRMSGSASSSSSRKSKSS